jgi:RNA polymerase sigma-54 factor
MLQQAIHLLQLSTVELQELLQKELQENPMLEEAPPDEAPGPEGELEAQGEAAPEDPRPEATPAPATSEPGEAAPDLPFDISEVIFGPPEERSLVQQEEQEDTRFENFVGTPTSLADHLDEQLRLTVVEPDVKAAAEEIIGNLDEDGYLRATIEEVAAKRNLPLPVISEALILVHGFDPIGVAARDLRECLLIQLRDPTRAQPANPLAIEILDQHFDALQRCKYPEIARALKVDQERVIEAVHEIATLEPKPGRRFAPVETRYIVPDVLVKKVGDDYAIILNEDGMPRLRINPYYRNVIGQGDEARRYVEDRMRSAIWLIKSIHQRQKTLYKVTNSIVQFQKAFLDKGLPHLRPLSLRDVAEDIRMHESTVSRVTTSKFVETPQGVLSLKFFFHSGIAKTQGDEVSSVSAKKMIEDLVAKEELTKPLSDQDVTKALRQEGLTIARRTVAKYREELGVLPSHQRRLAVRKRA